MAEQRKTSHAQAFDLSALVDEQMRAWSSTLDLPPLYRWVPPATVPGPHPQPRTVVRPLERPAERVRPEVQELLDAPEPLLDDVRGAFIAFLTDQAWTCHQCGKEVDRKTLKVPPPTLEAGRPTFHLYCSADCLDAGCSTDHGGT